MRKDYVTPEIVELGNLAEMTKAGGSWGAWDLLPGSENSNDPFNYGIYVDPS